MALQPAAEQSLRCADPGGVEQRLQQSGFRRQGGDLGSHHDHRERVRQRIYPAAVYQQHDSPGTDRYPDPDYIKAYFDQPNLQANPNYNEILRQPLVDSSNNYQGRVDQTLTKKDTIFFRWSN
jgi:hypothetical protein